ncbi:glutamine synthetase family protein [Alicyclobacillus acidocaldarius]|uniref:Glutamine synthetase n=1 Tax=Alicyclobacillus acidocaldarius subsp. acidocaldarius (strain ATCC 27009 / DSM 446 / BCRC 14685 / JCM 5260 / KCTC 1825 / NBRC 15652 / NCIMB 11725 / NRRL B-14509 / 104-IA) TaxID=521098 RepID=C8WSI8_ALIAD|nr:glutamine synthetase family protein [Alicyclobacillus acidocaldarius]ACV59473.1 glutamine synthetase catalytic region [Alicyclobacillus acidocaldarius subsp. acidocaldarius DSM 446]
MSSVASLLRRLEAERIGVAHLQFTDLMGSVKTVAIPASRLPDVLDRGVGFDGSSVEGFARGEESDMRLVPDLATACMWRPEFGGRALRIICDVVLPDGVPFAGDPRRILARALERARASGVPDMVVSAELEFFLLPQGEGAENAHLGDPARYFDAPSSDIAARCLRSMAKGLAEAGVPVTQIHHEAAPHQYEIDLTALSPLRAADALVTAKLVIRREAARFGFTASFMPKPFTDHPGSGLHLTFAPAGETADVPRWAAFAAGILAHACGLSAVANPTVNSYKRLGGSEAPGFVAWSDRHPAPYLRAVGNAWEWRAPDASANPYLAIACALAAGADGIEQALPLPNRLDERPEMWSEEQRFLRHVAALPQTLRDALDALEQDDCLQAALGDHALRHFLEAKRLEWSAYARTVHVWEREQYLTL